MGWRGALTATLAETGPSAVLAILMTQGYETWRSNAWVMAGGLDAPVGQEGGDRLREVPDLEVAPGDVHRELEAGPGHRLPFLRIRVPRLNTNKCLKRLLLLHLWSLPLEAALSRWRKPIRCWPNAGHCECFTIWTRRSRSLGSRLANWFPISIDLRFLNSIWS